MSFFHKKKKSPSGETLKSSLSPREPPSVAPEPQQTDMQLTSSTDSELTSPTVVKEPSSIFGGMVLSSSARKQEGQDSPYLSKGQPKVEEEEHSAFDFLSAVGNSGSLATDGQGDGDRLEKGGAGVGAGEEEKSVFGFISREPPELPKDNEEESGFPFLHSDGGSAAGGGGSSSEHVDSSREDPALPKNLFPPTITPSPLAVHEPLSQPAHQTVRNSSGTKSPVPGPVSPPLTSSDSSPAGGGRTPVGRQQPSTSKKKKKRKVVRPGQIDDPILVDVTADDVSTGVKTGGISVEADSKTELDSISLTSQTSSTVETGRDTTTTETYPTLSTTTDSLDIRSTINDEHSEGGVSDTRRESEGVMDSEPRGVVGIGNGGSVRSDARMQSDLLVDVSSSEQGHVEREEKEGSNDQQLLAEVFVSGESGEVEGKGEGGECEKGEEGRVKEGGGGKVKAEEVKSANYSVELTSSDQLTVLIQSSESNLAKIRLDLAALHSQKQSSLDQHISTAKQQKQNREQMKELRARETKALSEEDYELAEKIQGELESVSQDSSWNISTASHTLLLEWVQEVCDLMETEEGLQTDMRAQLTEMREKQSQALACAEEKTAHTHAKQKMKLKTLEDEIGRERGHIALDKEHLLKREQQLQDEINSRAERFISKKSTLQEELQTVHSDISELEMKLAELRQEEVRLQAAISEEERKIEAVHHELGSENSSLHQERDSLSKREQELQTKQVGVEEVRQEYETAQQEEQAQKQSINDVLGRVDLKWTESERRTHTLAQCLSRARDLTNTDTSTLLSPSQQLLGCREAVSEREGQVKKTAGRVTSLQSLISQLRRQITLSEERLPQLEEAKKTAVAARQYKEAGRMSSELKQLRTDLEPQRQQLIENEAEVLSHSQQLAALSAELAQERETLEEVERLEDMQHLRQLASILARLQATKASISGSSSPLEQVLDCWCQLYQLLADGLCAKHDMQLADFTPHMEPEERWKEGEKEDTLSEDGNGYTDGDKNLTQSSGSACQAEERTPGVGREEEEEEGKRLGGEDGPEVEEVKRKIAELESRIEEAVSEEVEDYELAADLDRELSELKEKLRSSVIN